MKAEFNPQPFLESAQLIQTTEELTKFLKEIEDTDIIAVDIESAGFYKYYARVNLIQIATREVCAIFDPQKIKDFSPLQEFVQTAKCTWIFHGGDYDISMLARDMGVFIPGMFDTRKAAELLGLSELSLRGLTEKILGFTLDKKLQRCDWSRRPLTDAMKKYALLDAICLVPVSDFLKNKLNEEKRTAWFKEECDYVAENARKATGPTYDPYAFRIKGSSKLSLRSLAILREVWKLRDTIAEKNDRAPFMLLSNHAMLEIARQRPRSIAGLSVIRSLNKEFLHRYGTDLQNAIKTGLKAELVGLEKPPRTRIKQNLLTAWEGELAKSLREIRDTRAEILGIAPPLLAPTQTLYDLARIRPSTVGELRQSDILHKWQVDILADDFIPLLQQEPPPIKRRRRRRRKKKAA